ncbi:unnamed protein product [Protopolystoma xenopodis]|uniref:Glycogen debranching enzyme glucanotransferase domain-containing protein n=1 Tax=Protopolystoma xenopodis TaxID=117903 RepID=A0A3S5CK80_9PLAT|nr:unnamed protein product [Protopolystoma xenopodis]
MSDILSSPDNIRTNGSSFFTEIGTVSNATAQSPTVDSCSQEISLKCSGPRGGRRFGATIDFEAARSVLMGIEAGGMPLSQCTVGAYEGQLRSLLAKLNLEMKEEVVKHMDAAVGNILANLNYRFFDPAGPMLGKVTEETPIMWK